MSKIKKLYAATIGLGFGLSHAKVFKNNKNVKLVCVNDLNVKKKKPMETKKKKFHDRNCVSKTFVP